MEQLRQLTLDGIAVDVPVGISRVKGGWRVRPRRNRVGRQFSDGKGGLIVSLEEAKNWLAGRPARQRYDMDLTRVDFRKLTLTRRFRSGGASGSKPPRFDLEISPSKSIHRASWMRMFLGSASTLNQLRIDQTIATLHARWDAYRALVAEHGREVVLASPGLAEHLKYLQAQDPPEPDARPYRTRLDIADVLSWTGDAEGVGFSPARTVQPGRKELYWPEKPIEDESRNGEKGVSTRRRRKCPAG